MTPNGSRATFRSFSRGSCQYDKKTTDPAYRRFYRRCIWCAFYVFRDRSAGRKIGARERLGDSAVGHPCRYLCRRLHRLVSANRLALRAHSLEQMARESPIRFLILCGVLFASAPMRIYEDAAGRAGVDPDEVQALAEAESRHNPRAVSGAGAVGLMQIMPATSAWFCKLSRAELFNATKNARCGAAYYAHLRARFRGNPVLAVAAYNAGPGAVERFGGVPPYTETRRHVEKWAAAYSRIKTQKGMSSSGKSPVASVPAGSATGGWLDGALSSLLLGISSILSQLPTCRLCFAPS